MCPLLQDGVATEPAQQHAGPKRRSMSAQLLSHSEAAGHRPKPTLPDIDSADRGDPLSAAEYVVDIFSYWKRCEPMFRVGPEYMTRQVPCA